jgi:hypothetical protein
VTRAGPEPVWLSAVRRGSFGAIPHPLAYRQSSHLAHLIDARQVCDALSWPEPRSLALERKAAGGGTWNGSALQLWCVLHYQHRRYRPDRLGELSSRELQEREALCAALRAKLQGVSPGERQLILTFIDAAQHPITAPRWG